MFPIDQQQQQHDYHEEHHKPHGDVREHLLFMNFRSKGDIESKEKETQENHPHSIVEKLGRRGEKDAKCWNGRTKPARSSIKK